MMGRKPIGQITLTSQEKYNIIEAKTLFNISFINRTEPNNFSE